MSKNKRKKHSAPQKTIVSFQNYGPLRVNHNKDSSTLTIAYDINELPRIDHNYSANYWDFSFDSNQISIYFGKVVTFQKQTFLKNIVEIVHTPLDFYNNFVSKKHDRFKENLLKHINGLYKKEPQYKKPIFDINQFKLTDTKLHTCQSNFTHITYAHFNTEISFYYLHPKVVHAIIQKQYSTSSPTPPLIPVINILLSPVALYSFYEEAKNFYDNIQDNFDIEKFVNIDTNKEEENYE